MKHSELISCVVPTFNRAHLLHETIQSVIDQTYQNWELILVDDQSTDNTKEVIESYIKKDKRIKYFLNPDKGGNYARNLGIQKSKGEYIALLDDDDVCYSNRFVLQIEAIKKGSSGFIVSGYDLENGETRSIKRIKYTSYETGVGFPSRWLLRKDLLLKAGLFDVNLPGMQDVEMSYRLAKLTTYEIHDAIVVKLVVWSGSVSRSKNILIGTEIFIREKQSWIPDKEYPYWVFRYNRSLWVLNEFEQLKGQRGIIKFKESPKLYVLERIFLQPFLAKIPILKIIINKNLMKLSLMPKTVEHKHISS